MKEWAKENHRIWTMTNEGSQPEQVWYAHAKAIADNEIFGSIEERVELAGGCLRAFLRTCREERVALELAS